MVNVGHSTKTAPASRREPSVPTSSARASLTRPAKPDGDRVRASTSRSVKPDGNVRELAEQVERRHGDGVADVLVLQRAEPLKRVPRLP